MNPSISINILTDNAATWLKDSMPHFLGQAYDAEWHARRKEFIQRSSWSHRATSVLELVNPKS
jgi:hypothetical protein